MYVRELRSDERVGFFEIAQAEGNIFTSEKWTSIYGPSLMLMGLFAKKSDKLMGGFCLYVDRKFGVPYLRTPPFTPHISVFYSVRSTNPSNINSFRKKVMFAIAGFIANIKGSLVNISFPPQEQDMQPVLWSKLKVSLRYTYHISLHDDENTILANFSPERRNDISKGLKDGLVVKKAQGFDEIQALINKTYAANNLRTYPTVLGKIFSNFASSENACGFLAFQNERPIACSFMVFNTRTAYYILGGYDREHSHHGAGALCIWEAIKEMKQQGVRTFDFEGSMIPAIESFFRGFGGALVPFYQIRKTPFINIYRL